MLCENCGKEIPEGSAFCPSCGKKLGQTYSAAEPPRTPAEWFVKEIRDDTRTSAILWIAIGCVQILGCITIIAGVWNLVMGIRRLNFSETIAPGNAEVYHVFDNGLTNLIITAVLNFILGGVVFALLCIWDYFIREKVIRNASVFCG